MPLVLGHRSLLTPLLHSWLLGCIAGLPGAGGEAQRWGMGLAHSALAQWQGGGAGHGAPASCPLVPCACVAARAVVPLRRAADMPRSQLPGWLGWRGGGGTGLAGRAGVDGATPCACRHPALWFLRSSAPSLLPSPAKPCLALVMAGGPGCSGTRPPWRSRSCSVASPAMRMRWTTSSPSHSPSPAPSLGSWRR